MSKVIVERPRRGRAAAGLRRGRTRALTDDDGEPLKAKGAREPKGRAEKTKALNETLNPLKRYLASNVDRPWNKVFSEISAHLKPTSTVQQHVRDHLEDFVATKTRMKDGVVWVSSRRDRAAALEDSNVLYYVHPRTGLLRENPHRIKRGQLARQHREAIQAELDTRMRAANATTQYHLFDGAWWAVKLAKIRRSEHRDAKGLLYYLEAPYTDVVRSAKLSKLPLHKLYGRHGVYAAAKRQLSKTEMKRLKLR